MDASILSVIRSVATTRTYQPDEKVFVEGSPGSTMYVILDGNVEISVKDTGCGIARDNLDKIFVQGYNPRAGNSEFDPGRPGQDRPGP